MAEIKTTLYRVQRFQRWDEMVSTDPSFDVPIVKNCGVGFMPVYESLEEAQREHPGVPVTPFLHIRYTGEDLKIKRKREAINGK